jgi:hypothetical protein
MKLSKVDLSSVLAIAHSNGQLGLLLDRGSEIELIEIAAPVQAYEGLQQLSNIIADFESEEIPMLPVSSSCAAAVGYDSNEQILQIEFHNGAVYQYSGVDEETWEDFYLSDNLGQFYNREIKGQYECDLFSGETYTLGMSGE